MNQSNYTRREMLKLAGLATATMAGAGTRARA